MAQLHRVVKGPPPIRKRIVDRPWLMAILIASAGILFVLFFKWVAVEAAKHQEAKVSQYDNTHKLHVGMPEDDAVAIMGVPDSYTFSESERSPNSGMYRWRNGYDSTTVFFSNGKIDRIIRSVR